MRVLLLGSGAKDHAIAWWFSKSSFLSALFVAPGNLATQRFATNLPSVNIADPGDVYQACVDNRIDFVFIGTETPLFTGVVKYLNDRGIETFGAPSASLKLEGDRSFSRAFSNRHNIPVPRGSFFSRPEELKKYLDKHKGETFIIKSNSVSPSRIMLSSNDTEALMSFAATLFPKGNVLLEEYIKGTPATCTLLVDRNGYLALPVTSDYMHKSADDNTPTGGMGAICPVPLLEKLKGRIKERIIDPTLYGMRVEQLSYKGVLTLSMMIKEDGEPYLVDYHVRLNDPATQAMVPLINTDLISILYAMRSDTVNTIDLDISDMCTVAVVLASDGYPLYPQIGKEITGLDARMLEPLLDYPDVFIGAIQEEDGKAITTGGRNITVVGKGRNLQEANREAYRLIEKKRFNGLWYREDIGNAYFT